MKVSLIVAALVVPMVVMAGEFPAGSPRFASSLSAATKAASVSGKPVVVVFSASWCPPCQTMKNEVYPSAAVKAFHDRFEWAYLDVDDESNAAAAEKLGVDGIPHIQFLSTTGKDLGQQVGSSSAEEFAKRLEKVLKKSGSR